MNMEWHTSGQAPTFGFDMCSHQLQLALGLLLEVRCLVESQILRLAFTMSDFVNHSEVSSNVCGLPTVLSSDMKARVSTLFLKMWLVVLLFFLL
jgi:hypothetical protein